MDWFESYQMFNKLDAEISNAFSNQTVIMLYDGDSDGKGHRFNKKVSKINEWVNHHLGQFKVEYREKSKKISNIYTLIDSELKDLINRFADNKFNIIVDGHKEKEVNGKKQKTPTKIYFHYELAMLYEDLKNKRLKAESSESLTFYLLWAHVEYWNWLHQQNPLHLDIRTARMCNSTTGELMGIACEHENDEEMLIDLIITKGQSPYQTFSELQSFLDSLNNESRCKTLIFYVRDKAHSFFLLEGNKNGFKLARDIDRQTRSKEELQAFYKQFIGYINQVYGTIENPSMKKSNNASTTPKLIWNGNKNTLIDIFYQLKNMPAMKGNKALPLLDNTYEEIAIFLKENFETFKETKVKTIETVLTKGDQKPTKPNGKISLVRGFITD
jgi:hypothetical protein